MNRLITSKLQPRTSVGGILVALAMCVIAAGCTTSSGTKSGIASSPSATSAESPKPLTGAELYAINCNRCHAERAPTEWNPAQWQTVLTHMRVRANLPAEQARTILKYLQENGGS